MQVKKPSPRKKILAPSSSRPKLSSTKGPTPKSPLKSDTGKSAIGHHPSRDFFNYTPLRQHKSLTCSTPDLSINKSMIKDQPLQQILSNKKSILDQSDILKKKLKEFKIKINENRVIKSKDPLLLSSRRAPENGSQALRMHGILEKVLRRKERNTLQGTFGVFKEISLSDLTRAIHIFKIGLKKKSLCGLRKCVEMAARADMHYKLQLMVKSFLRWNDLMMLEKSWTSIQTSDSSARTSKESPEVIKNLPKIERDLSKTVKYLSGTVKELSENVRYSEGDKNAEPESRIKSKTESESESEIKNETEAELVMLADQFYASSLKHFMGIKPWKLYISRKGARIDLVICIGKIISASLC